MIDLIFSTPKRRDLASGGKNHTLPRTVPPGRELRGRQKAPGANFFKKVLETAAQELKLKGKISVSVNLVGEARIRELNRKYRNKNKPTDVLSFPLNEKFEIRNSKLEIEDIGDVFVCLSIAKKEAKRENISIEKKLAQLTVHGFLHLAGYDHEKSKKDADRMFRIEGKILSKLNKI